MPLKWTRLETCICSPSLARHEQSTGEHRASTEQAERPPACHALASSCAVLTSVHRAWGLGCHRLTEQLQCCRVEGQCQCDRHGLFTRTRGTNSDVWQLQCSYTKTSPGICVCWLYASTDPISVGYPRRSVTRGVAPAVSTVTKPSCYLYCIVSSAMRPHAGCYTQ